MRAPFVSGQLTCKHVSGASLFLLCRHGDLTGGANSGGAKSGG